jgi:23S rRNA G2445 N2-methylase RlmL
VAAVEFEEEVRAAEAQRGRWRAGARRARRRGARRSSTLTGYHSFAPVLERARTAARAAQVNDRVQFELLDAADGLPDTYDPITAYQVPRLPLGWVGSSRTTGAT